MMKLNMVRSRDQFQKHSMIRYISIDELYLELGETLCKKLPAYHALTGSDYTSSFSRKGKIKPLKIIENSPKFQSAFIGLAEEPTIGNR